MKILLVNNFHYIRGGAEKVYFDTAKILERHGHEVAFFSTQRKENFPTQWDKYFPQGYEMDSPHSLPTKLSIAIKLIHNRKARKKFAQILDDFKPDVIHFHNIYYHLSFSIVPEGKKRNIPMTMTLHDFKLISPFRFLYHNGKMHEKTKRKKFYWCFLDKCTKNSYMKSFLSMLEAYANELSGYYKMINIFISPSNFLLKKFKEFSFKQEIIHIPNPINLEQFNLSEVSEEDYLIYFGRLSPEKGVDDLIHACKNLSEKIKLKIVGEGPEEKNLKNLTKQLNLQNNIEFTGYKSDDELWNLVAKSKAVIFPSKWNENLPMSVIEAMSLGKICVCPKLGGFTELTDNGRVGILYEGNNITDLTLKIEDVSENYENYANLGKNAADFIQKLTNENAYYESLLKVYNQIIKTKTR